MWDVHRKPLENAIASALQDTVGMGAMNVYIKKNNDKLSRGYFHDDNLVQLILNDLDLEDVPRLWKPDVSFSLASNVLKVESHVSRMILHGDYILLRNKSDIIYEMCKQNASKTSPFLFEQVQTMGQIAVSMDRCLLSGFAIVTMSGASVNLGHYSFKLCRCQYTVEIFKPGFGSPPVIAKYYPIGDGLALNQLVLQPIYEDLIPKLQATLFSFVNTTDIFHAEEGNMRKRQETLFQTTSGYLSEIVRNLNKLTIKRNNGALQLEDHTFVWDDTTTSESGFVNQLKLTNMVLTGLDTVYSAHTGGPYKITDLEIGEQIRFNSIQVRGSVALITGPEPVNNINEFATELTDVNIDIMLCVDTRKASLKKLEITGIRGMEFSLPGIVFPTLEPMITGYLLREVPKQLLTHLKLVFEQAILDTRNSLSSGGDAKEKLLRPFSSSSGNYLKRSIKRAEEESDGSIKANSHVELGKIKKKKKVKRSKPAIPSDNKAKKLSNNVKL